jgi:hypothetical protein
VIVAVAATKKNVANVLAPRGAAVCVHPGHVRTQKTPAALRWNGPRALRNPEVEAEQMLSRAKLLTRLVEAYGMVAIIAFSASPCVGAINGDSLALGGRTAGPIHY